MCDILPQLVPVETTSSPDGDQRPVPNYETMSLV
jgi:hypothetical protein